jgi:hypothetical protein
LRCTRCAPGLVLEPGSYQHSLTGAQHSLLEPVACMGRSFCLVSEAGSYQHAHVTCMAFCLQPVACMAIVRCTDILL